MKTSYGDTPVTLASSGVQRILQFAYLLVWAWTEHVRIAEILGFSPGQDLALLIDEVELHLHPRWQREVLPAILRSVSELSDLRTQVIATTHSPLVLASVESVFNDESDKLFHIDREVNLVRLEELDWSRQGGADGWLTSPAFGLIEPRSVEAESAIVSAEGYLQGNREKTVAEIDDSLRAHLPGQDPFLARWFLYRKMP